MSYILTLKLDPASQEHFNELRRQHYPAERNLIDAHVTLFHTLPEESAVVAAVRAATEGTLCFSAAVAGVRPLGKGVAYTLESGALQALHRRLAAEFAEHLSPQDRQRFQPHIVVQNKATVEAARVLLFQLRASFRPRMVEGTGLSLWHYRGGPWEHAADFEFLSRAER